MGLIERLRSWFAEEETDEPQELREFLYLDETSVVSLLASLEGEITESLITRSESVNRELGRSNKGLSYKGTGYNRVNESETLERSGSETIQRSVIQSRFDELYESRQDQLRLPTGEAVSLEDVGRGELLEFDGLVRVAESYRVFKILEYMSDTFENMEEFGELDGDFRLEELKAISGFLSSLFGDQVPVRVQAVNYRIVNDQIRNIQDLESEEVGEPLSVVAYLSRDSLWDDPLTVFSGVREFTIYGRVITDNADWKPLRLTRVLEEHFPDQAGQINAALKSALLNLEREGGKRQVSINVEKNLGEMLSDLEVGLETRGYAMDETDLMSFTSAERPLDMEFDEYGEARDELIGVLDDSDVDVDSDEKAELLWETVTGESDLEQENDEIGFEIAPIGIYW